MFSHSTLLTLAAVLVMSPLPANAHMILKNPVPFGISTKSPLMENGSDFPCKAVTYTVKTTNQWPVGSTQTLEFTGTAVHGGGSCQISVTTDKAPTKATKWKVIYSIEGGCPAAAEGNLDDQGSSSATTFPFTVPKELPSGELTMAWTWFNRIGNREMYMECAPVTISGGASDTTEFDALPDMAVANIAGQGTCKTTEGSDFSFENPGKYATKAGVKALTPLCGGVATGGGAAPAPQAPLANPGIPAPAPVPSAAPVSSAAPVPSAAPSASQATATSTFRTIFTVTAPMAPASTADSNLAPPQASAAPNSPQLPALDVPTPAPGTGRGSDTSSDTSCSPNGAVVCSPDGTQFAICNFGAAVFTTVAAGTKCLNGAIAKRDFTHRAQRTVIWV